MPGEWVRRKLDDERITKMYLEEKVSTQQIAKQIGVSRQTIGRLLNDLGVKRRKPSEVNRAFWDRMTRLPITVTEKQDQIIIGTLLGDGHVGTQASSINPSFSVSHKESDKEYLLWKYKELQSTELFRNPPFQRSKFLNGKEFKRWTIRSRQHPILKEYRDLMYREKDNMISLRALERCGLLGLAVYYMDDGGLRKLEWYYSESPKVPCFYTYAYTEQEILLLRYFLDSRWGIHSELKGIKYGTPRKLGNILLVDKRSVPRFRELIVPYILPITCMHRKIP